MSYRNVKFLYDYKIDIIKSLAIISVIILHLYPENLLKRIYYQFYIGQCVGVFIILIGMTSLVTFKEYRKRKRLSLKELYSKQYFVNKIKRIIMPFLPITFLSFLILRSNDLKSTYSLQDLFIGRLPIEVPGNYFITLMLQVIIFLPLMFYLYKKNAYRFLLFSLIINFIFELIAPRVNILANNNYIYKSSLLRYLFLIASGLYISDDYWHNKHISVFQEKYHLFTCLFPLSAVYLFLGQFTRQPFPFFDKSWGTLNILSFPYTVLFTVFILNLNYKHFVAPLILNVFIIVGKASYYIYLVQLLFFNLLFFNSKNDIIFHITYINILLVMSCGIFYFYLYNYILKSFSKIKT